MLEKIFTKFILISHVANQSFKAWLALARVVADSINASSIFGTGIAVAFVDV